MSNHQTARPDEFRESEQSMRPAAITREKILPFGDAPGPRAEGSPYANGYVQPRSISVGGKRTTVRLEEDYWNELERIAVEAGTSINAIVTSINAEAPRNLTSAIRVYVLRRTRDAVDAALQRRRRALGG